MLRVIYRKATKPNPTRTALGADKAQVSTPKTSKLMLWKKPDHTYRPLTDLNGDYFSPLRKNRVYIKSRFSRVRQWCRPIVMWSLWVNIGLLFFCHTVFYGVKFNLGYTSPAIVAVVTLMLVPPFLRAVLQNRRRTVLGVLRGLLKLADLDIQRTCGPILGQVRARGYELVMWVIESSSTSLRPAASWVYSDESDQFRKGVSRHRRLRRLIFRDGSFWTQARSYSTSAHYTNSRNDPHLFPTDERQSITQARKIFTPYLNALTDRLTHLGLISTLNAGVMSLWQFSLSVVTSAMRWVVRGAKKYALRWEEVPEGHHRYVPNWLYRLAIQSWTTTYHEVRV